MVEVSQIKGLSAKLTEFFGRAPGIASTAQGKQTGAVCGELAKLLARRSTLQAAVSDIMRHPAWANTSSDRVNNSITGWAAAGDSKRGINREECLKAALIRMKTGNPEKINFLEGLSGYLKENNVLGPVVISSASPAYDAASRPGAGRGRGKFYQCNS